MHLIAIITMKMIYIQMAPNETANIVIESTELAGASATCENWFRIQ